MLSTAVADLLMTAYQESGRTQTDIASQAGVSQSQLSKYLRGVKVPDIDQLDRICRALNLDLIDILEEART